MQRNGPQRSQRWLPLREMNRGFTLVELLVGILISLLVVLAVLIIQTRLAYTNMQLTDTGQRNDQARVAMNVLQQDIGNSLFMLNGAPGVACDTTWMHTGSGTHPIVPIFAVMAQPQTADLAFPGVSANTMNSYGTMGPQGFPSWAATGSVSQMLTIATMPAAVRAPTTGFDAVKPVHSSAKADSNILPLGNVIGINASDAATLVVPLADTSHACLRFKIGSVTPATQAAGGNPASPAQVTLEGSHQFDAFNAGLGAGVLSDATLRNATLRIEGEGDVERNVQRYVYYVARVSNGTESGTVPVLARATLRADGSLAGSPVPVAAGIVSLQALFGVAQEGDSGVTKYVPWGSVTSPRSVRSVVVAIVARTMQSHKDNPEVDSVTIPSPGSGSNAPSFTSYIPKDEEEKRDRFLVLTSEIALRNQLWSGR